MEDWLLRRCLDGELDPRELPRRLRRRAEAWEALVGVLRERLPDRAPVGLADDVVRRIRAEGRERG